MWSSKSIFKNCGNLRISEGFWLQISSYAPDAIFVAVSNIASLLLVCNKNVVFHRQILIFMQILFYSGKSRKMNERNNICCWKTTILLKNSNSDVMLFVSSNIASGPSENLAYALLNFLTRVFGRFLEDLLRKLIFHFL